jgi:hypothetical protein
VKHGRGRPYLSLSLSLTQSEKRKNEFISTEKWNFININFPSLFFPLFPLAFIAHFNGKHISLLSDELPSFFLSLSSLFLQDGKRVFSFYA